MCRAKSADAPLPSSLLAGACAAFVSLNSLGPASNIRVKTLTDVPIGWLTPRRPRSRPGTRVLCVRAVRASLILRTRGSFNLFH
ncbi:unnamed protein product [Gadus morhua 'NCC']